MLMRTRYHPLVDRDTEGKDKYPLFHTEDEKTALNGHGYYLEEMFPRFYRLCCGNKKAGVFEKDLRIHCPLCGSVMDVISTAKDKKHRSIYMCRECNKERKE